MAITDIDAADILRRMLAAARDAAQEGWADLSAVVESELPKLVVEIENIAKGVALGQLSKRTAASLLRMTRNNVIAAIALAANVVKKTIERIVNAAIAAIREIVNGAVKFALI